MELILIIGSINTVTKIDLLVYFALFSSVEQLCGFY